MKLLMPFLSKHYLIFTVLILTCIVSAVLEGMGISLVFPVLQSIVGATSELNIPFPFNKVAHLFKDLSLTSLLKAVSIWLLVVTLIKNWFLYLVVIISSRLRVMVMKYFKGECINKIMYLGMGYFNKRKGSDFQVIIESHIEFGLGGIIFLIGNMLVIMFNFLILLILLFLLSWKLTLLSIALVGSASFGVNILYKKITAVGKRIVQSKYKQFSALFDIVNGIKLIHLYNRESFMTKKFHHAINEYNIDVLKSDRINGLIGPVFEIVSVCILALLVFIGSYFISSSHQAIMGILLTFIVILTRMIPKIKVFNSQLGTLCNRWPTVREIEKFLEGTGEEKLKQGTAQFSYLQKNIEFQSIAFSYSPQDSRVFTDLSFQIQKGTKVGIVGLSGSGKSTIVELLFRFYDPNKGSIYIDGVDLKGIDLRSWRGHIGIVSQDTFLFHDTIKNNISFSKPYASHDEIIQAAQRANIHNFIANLPNGYDTLVGDRGVLLSGGERQRISISRAILCEPAVLIFDEATSSLDTESEKIVQKAIEEISINKTVIAIAHRLSTLTNFDKIVVIKNGHCIEEGTHQQLIKKDGLYKKLVEMQTLEKNDAL
ncbi:MAG: ABC transporter ATP-binding protein [bacterium]